MNKRTMKKMTKAKQQAAEAAKTAETDVKTAAPAKEVKPTTEKTLHTEAAEGKAEAAKEPKKATKKETVKKAIKNPCRRLVPIRKKKHVLYGKDLTLPLLLMPDFRLCYDAV